MFHRWFGRLLSRAFWNARWRSVIVGGGSGSVLAIGLHLFTRDSAFGVTLHKRLTRLMTAGTFDGIGAYKRELIALCVFVAVPVLLLLSSACLRYLRSWWKGGVSAIGPLAAAGTLLIVMYGSQYPERTVVGVGLCWGVMLALEGFLAESSAAQCEGQASWETLKLSIPQARGKTSFEEACCLPSSDDPIDEWKEDILDRSAVVELLANHALLLRTPIVALHGSLGDGKSSVLNLLRRALEGKAIVVSFSCWLPSSEETLAVDLFRDIASECRKRFYVPELRKRGIAYARIISGSVSYLAGLKDMLSGPSQREEILELREALARVPQPIVVLLDEVDRMQKEELLVLLKILRGASYIPNITFICAFSEREIRAELSNGGPLSYDYLEKFFPVSINLTSPSPEMLGHLFQKELTKMFGGSKWFQTPKEEEAFRGLLESLWGESLYRVCTNLRKLRLLLNDVATARLPMEGEVNACDLIAIESLRRFYPEVYGLIRVNPLFLAYFDNSWAKGQYFSEERRKEDGEQFFKQLGDLIDKMNEPVAAKVLLSFLFPAYLEASQERLASLYASWRPTGADVAEREKRISDPDHFSIYFRAAVPENMISNAELRELQSGLNAAKSQEEVDTIFHSTLSPIPSKSPKRDDLLWKLGRGIDHLTDVAAERVAYSAALYADEYTYGILHTGEGSRAINIVFESAQKLSSTPKAQTILETALARASDDTFAVMLLEYTVNKGRNRILTDFSNIDPKLVEQAFISRMRKRYDPLTAQTANIKKGDWHAFRTWVNKSQEDATMEQEFWRQYIGTSRKRLAQAINFLYPGNVGWSEDPRQVISPLFPIEELARLVESLEEHEPLDEIEQKAISRLQKLGKGDWVHIGG